MSSLSSGKSLFCTDVADRREETGTGLSCSFGSLLVSREDFMKRNHSE
jgi:hypothetical protein